MNRNIKSVINQKKELLDKNRNGYLILELENGESIFVFPGKVGEERWERLREGEKISFTVEEGRNGTNLLVDYEVENEVEI